MKKSSIFIIIVVFAVSIVVVTFFGMAISMDQFKVYMTSIEITNETTKMYDTQGNVIMDLIMLPFNYADTYSSVIIDYVTTPEDATEKNSVRFYLSSNATYTDPETGEVTIYADVRWNGEVVFYSPASIRAYVTTTDGSQLTDYVDIWCYDPAIFG
ncbi:MAG: hypothetical protein LUB56_02500 [Coprobacillus sp.]|nr:hypothetical protein [Coprobacillus sp.]